MKILTWNMAFWTHQNSHDFAGHYLVSEIKPGIALEQEAKLPSDREIAQKIIVHEIGEKSRWGSGVYSKNLPINKVVLSPRAEEVLPDDFHGGVHRNSSHKAERRLWLYRRSCFVLNYNESSLRIHTNS